MSRPLNPAEISSAPTPGIGDRACAHRTGRSRRQHGLEHCTAHVDVAGIALLIANVLVVHGDDAILRVDHAAELVLVDHLDERGETAGRA